MSNISAEDLALISAHVGELFNQRITSTEEILSESIKALQAIHEINHNSLYSEIKNIKKELSEVKSTAENTEKNTKITNGRVNKIEDDFYGELDKNKNPIKGREGILHDVLKIKQHEYAYNKKLTPYFIGGIFTISLIMVMLLISSNQTLAQIIETIIKIL